MSLKKTPLYPMHLKYQGKMIDFSGWALPVQYTGQSILQEHRMVREKAGLFDVSHMGEILITGEGAEAFLQNLVCNDVKGMQDNQVLYSPMCYPHGGVVDDLLIYRYHPQKYLLVVNAVNLAKNLAWLGENQFPGVWIEDVSAEYAQLALQGPRAEEILQALTTDPLSNIKFFHFKAALRIAGVECMVSRTGYTGEDGFEIYVAPAKAVLLWEKLQHMGAENLCLAGLGARDSLRFEAQLPLYGQELTPEITPLEAGLGFFVKLNTKDNFIGKEALVRQKAAGLTRRLIGFSMLGRGIPRSQYEVQSQGRSIGWVTTGMYAPTMKKALGLALINSAYSVPGTEIEIIIHGKPTKASVQEQPFYRKKTKRK